MKSADQATRSSVLSRLIDLYGLTGATIVGPPQSGYRNTSHRIEPASSQSDPTARQPLNLILYKAEPGILARIQAANRISDYVAAAGLPTRQTAGRILQLTPRSTGTPDSLASTSVRIRYVCLYNYLPGSTIPWEAYTMDHIKLLGLAMSRLHAALAEAPEPARPARQVVGESEALLSRMQTYFAEPGVTQSLNRKLNLQLQPHALATAQAAVRLAAKLPDHQPLHLDFVRGNILFGPSADHPKAPLTLGDLTITGIIDFEKTATGPRIFDLARTLAFLYVDCQAKTPAQITKYFLRSGYNKRGSIRFEPPLIKTRDQSINLLQPLINFYLLHDLYKFLRHNPYEYLSQNEHFVRTAALLATRSLI